MLPRTMYGHSWPSRPMPWPSAVGEVAVARAEAAVFDHPARRGVHGLALDARPGRVEGGLLRAPHEVPHPALPVASAALRRRPVRVMSLS